MEIWGVPLFYEGRLKYGIWNEFRENIDFKYRTPKKKLAYFNGKWDKNTEQFETIKSFLTFFFRRFYLKYTPHPA